MEISAIEEWHLSTGARDPLQELCPGLVKGRGLLVLGAHPDDEVIGAAGHIPDWPEAVFVHLTDGAPYDMLDARRQGFNERETYAAARHQELQQALALAGVPRAQVSGLGFVDQESSFHLPELVHRCLDLLRSLQPLAVLTHPYEGGHPDHDSAAFAVQAASRLLKRSGERCPAIIEMTSYHNEAGSMQTRQFLFSASRRPIILALSPEQRSIKRRMFGCFDTQRTVLQWFPIDFESFRLAPDYDFSQPPHPGVLYYELFNWGINGETWRERVVEALAALGLPEQLPSTAEPRLDTWWRMAG